MKTKGKADLVVRGLLALMLVVFGLDKFMHFMPVPEPPEEGGAFLGALLGAGYIFPTIGIVFLVAALSLVTDCVLLALVLLAPVVLNILFYHFRYEVPGIGAGAVIALLAIVLAFMHKSDLKPLFRSSR